MKKEQIYEIVSELVNNESYDIMEAVELNDLQEVVWCIVNHYDKHPGALVFDTTLAEYSVRVNNKRKGFVSVSGNEVTGVSETLMQVYFTAESIDERVENIISMINEAWYTIQ